jgi:hypothetical protein
VKFLPEWGPVNLALSQGGGPGAGPVDHLGVQVESTTEVVAQLARIKAAGLPVLEEMGVDCCHANQDKFWVKDPDGVEWEVYHLNYDLEDEAQERPSRAEQPTFPSARQGWHLLRAVDLRLFRWQGKDHG